MPGYFVKTVHKGNKVYHINYGRIVMSVVLLLAVIVFGVCMLIFRDSEKQGERTACLALHAIVDVERAEGVGADETALRCARSRPRRDEPGTSAEGIDEKDINLSICLETEKILRAYGYTVLMTRRDDSDVDTMAVFERGGRSARRSFRRRPSKCDGKRYDHERDRNVV